jgi:peptidoglycan/LPS O-acetylase OafA/YrhL
MNSDTQRAAHIRSRIRDFVIYIAIGFAFVGLLIVVAKTGVSQDVYIRWGGLAFMTAVLFGYFISNSGRFLREWRFWALAAILMLVHLAAFAVILTHVDEWKLIWFVGMAIEYPVFVFFRSRLPNPSQESEA